MWSATLGPVASILKHRFRAIFKDCVHHDLPLPEPLQCDTR